MSSLTWNANAHLALRTKVDVAGNKVPSTIFLALQMKTCLILLTMVIVNLSFTVATPVQYVVIMLKLDEHSITHVTFHLVRFEFLF